MKMSDNLVTFSAKDLRDLQAGYKTVLANLPKPRWWQVGIFYLRWYLSKAIVAMDVVLSLMQGGGVVLGSLKADE